MAGRYIMAVLQHETCVSSAHVVLLAQKPRWLLGPSITAAISREMQENTATLGMYASNRTLGGARSGLQELSQLLLSTPEPNSSYFCWKFRILIRQMSLLSNVTIDGT